MRRPSAVGIVAVALVAAALDGRARAGDATERYALRAELGVEYDENAHRTEAVEGLSLPTVSSPLARGVLTATLADTVGAHQDVALSATAAGKLFQDPDARNEDVAIAQSAAAWRVRMSRTSALSLSGVYYEAFQHADWSDASPSGRRDFRSVVPSLSLGLEMPNGIQLGAGVGYRVFVFKPDRDFDFQAPTAALDLRWTRESADGVADWETAVGAAYEHRTFGGPALENLCVPPAIVGQDCLPTPGRALRTDDFLIARLEAARTGRVLFGVGYAFQYNRSNSFTDTVTRHFANVRFAAPLPLDIFVTARADLLFAFYPQGTVVGQSEAAGRPFTSIEDENRSSVRVDLSRNLTDRLQLIARYTFYGPALTGTAVVYRRQTALLSLAFTIEK